MSEAVAMARLNAMWNEMVAQQRDWRPPRQVVSPRFARLVRDLAWPGDEWTPTLPRVRALVRRGTPQELYALESMLAEWKWRAGFDSRPPAW